MGALNRAVDGFGGVQLESRWLSVTAFLESLEVTNKQLVRAARRGVGLQSVPPELLLGPAVRKFSTRLTGTAS